MSQRIATVGTEEIAVELRKENGTAYVRAGESELEIDVLSIGMDEAMLSIDGRRVRVPFIREGGRVELMLDGEVWSVDIAAPGRGRQRHREHSMSAPMPGMALKILVAPGDAVKKGAPLMILEAMKMEHPITAPYDGTVKAIHCREGELVQPGADLIEIEAAEES
ncbi:MAG: biotin/lipoyl-containing protein [Thermoanaerobaculia bacterium]